MLPKYLVALIEQNLIDHITISRPSPNAAWSVSAYGKSLPADVVNQIELSAEGSNRLWADLDAAYSFIRKNGYLHNIVIEG